MLHWENCEWDRDESAFVKKQKKRETARVRTQEPVKKTAKVVTLVPLRQTASVRTQRKRRRR